MQGLARFLNCFDGLSESLRDVLLLVGRIFIAIVFLMTVSGGGPALSTHVLATLGIRDAFEVARPDLGVAAVLTSLPLMIPLVLILMRKLRTTEVTL